MLTVIYDACVLYSAAHRDLLMFLAALRFYRACWSNEIHEEWIRSVLKSNPNVQRERLERTRRMMDEHSDDCLIEGYEYLVDQLELPDPNDRHVLAAAIHAGACVIVTFNLSDFPDKKLRPYGIDAKSPDDFISQLIHFKLQKVLEAVALHRANLKNPPKTVEEYLETLRKQKLTKTVAFLEQHQNEI